MRSVLVVLLSGSLVATACSGGSEPDRSAQSAPAASSGPLSSLAAAAPADTTPIAVDSASTGVIGLTGDDPFCTELAVLASSVSLIGLTEAFGDAAVASELEIVAAASVVQAFAEIYQGWPADVSAERSMFESVYGGYVARSDDALAAAGSDDAELPERLDAHWRDLLATTPIDAPLADVAVGPSDRTLLEPAVQRFITAAGQRGDDSRLGAPQPISAAFESYVVQRCGAVATLLPIDEI